jgi:hypothetical protein
MRGLTTVVISSLATVSSAASHLLFAGNLNSPAAIHLLEFNEETKTLQKVKTFPADSPHNWITLDVGFTLTNIPSVLANILP